MNNANFNEIVSSRIEKIQDLLASKGKEYAGDRGDRLHNFKRAAETMRCSPVRALVGMWMKHIISILDMVDELEVGGQVHIGRIDEKIGDAINYLILMEALMKEDSP